MKLIKQSVIEQLYNSLDNLEMCYKIIDGISGDAISEYGFNLPSIIASTNSVALIDYVLKTARIRFAQQDEYGYTALHFAAKFNCLDACNYIITKKLIDINLPTLSGYTPLLLAASSADIGLVKLLVNNGANILATSHTGKNILYYAQNNQNEGVTKYLTTLLLGDTYND